MKNKPLVSFCIFTYNQEKFISEAIDGALSQDYSNLEIIITDDCSSDATWAIINEKIKNYIGKHTIILNRNERNLGLVPHVNKILFEVSKGDYVAVAAGDDISLPERVSKTIEFFINHHDVVAISSELLVIDAESKLHTNQRENEENDSIFDLTYFLSKQYKHITGASRTFSRELITAFPPLDENCPTEDTTMLLRAFMIGKVALLKDKLVKYRLHGSNISSPEGLKKMKLENIFEQNFRDIDFAKETGLISTTDANELKAKVTEIKNERLGLKFERNFFVKNKIIYNIGRKFNGRIKRIKKLSKIAISFLKYQLNPRPKVWWWKILPNDDYYKENLENFGDMLTPYLVEKLTGLKPIHFNPLTIGAKYITHSLMTGSMIRESNSNTIVWGSGIIKKQDNIKGGIFKAVRGQMTINRLRQLNMVAPIIVGDPAILLPLIYKPQIKKKYKYGIIPHYVDFEDISNDIKFKDDVFIVNLLTKDIENVIDEILACEYIISSSLHGIIVANVYQIPTVWLRYSDKLSGDDIKFHDYYSSVNCLNASFIDKSRFVNGIFETFDFLLPNQKVFDKIQIDLLESFPYKLKKKYKIFIK